MKSWNTIWESSSVEGMVSDTALSCIYNDHPSSLAIMAALIRILSIQPTTKIWLSIATPWVIHWHLDST
jgi:hypothetical protein